MTTTERDAQALTYLARRLREETHGANKWDEPGIHAVVSELVGQDLAITVERVTRHAADPAAKTPGAIRRPFLPDAKTPTRTLDVAPVGSRCTICGEQQERCRRLWSPTGDAELNEAQGRHQFARPLARDVELASVVAELKGLARPAANAHAEQDTSQGIA